MRRAIVMLALVTACALYAAPATAQVHQDHWFFNASVGPSFGTFGSTAVADASEDQVLGLLRYGNVLAAHGDEIFVLAIAALFVATIAVRPAPRLDRQWRLPLLAVLSLVAYLGAPYDMGYMGYIHLRALPFLALLVIASPSIAPGPATSAILAAVVALQIAFQTSVAATYRAFDREAQVTELHQVLHAAEPGKRPGRIG